MKKILLLFCLILLDCFSVYAQTGSVSAPSSTWYEWNVNNTSSATGERIIAYLNAPTIGTYTGCSIFGQIIDANGNWGYALPTVANFTTFANFTNATGSIMQDASTSNITLELKTISTTQWALVGNCTSINKSIRILLRISQENGVTITLGDPTTVNTTGTLLVSAPTYQASLPGSRLLINTTSANAAHYNLAVGGSAIAQSMTVQLQGNWADYVFGSSYQLRPLPELKAYIDQYHHLPDIPSEKEVKDSGIDLGEMNKRLTQKVEELTLYLIDKDKQLTEQQKISKHQQEQIDRLSQRLDSLAKASAKARM